MDAMIGAVDQNEGCDKVAFNSLRGTVELTVNARRARADNNLT